jgi:hypothetical protein
MTDDIDNMIVCFKELSQFFFFFFFFHERMKVLQTANWIGLKEKFE